MTHPIYAFGYTGRRFAEVVTAVAAADAVLIDTRYSPRSRAPQWNRSRLEEALGGRYRWGGGTLGNVAYRTGGIAITDLATGLVLIEEAAATSPVALMCVCASAAACHRSVIASALRARGHTVIEGLPGTQLPLCETEAES